MFSEFQRAYNAMEYVIKLQMIALNKPTNHLVERMKILLNNAFKFHTRPKLKQSIVNAIANCFHIDAAKRTNPAELIDILTEDVLIQLFMDGPRGSAVPHPPAPRGRIGQLIFAESGSLEPVTEEPVPEDPNGQTTAVSADHKTITLQEFKDGDILVGDILLVARAQPANPTINDTHFNFRVIASVAHASKQVTLTNALSGGAENVGHAYLVQRNVDSLISFNVPDELVHILTQIPEEFVRYTNASEDEGEDEGEGAGSVEVVHHDPTGSIRITKNWIEITGYTTNRNGVTYYHVAYNLDGTSGITELRYRKLLKIKKRMISEFPEGSIGQIYFPEKGINVIIVERMRTLNEWLQQVTAKSYIVKKSLIDLLTSPEYSERTVTTRCLKDLANPPDTAAASAQSMDQLEFSDGSESDEGGASI